MKRWAFLALLTVVVSASAQQTATREVGEHYSRLLDSLIAVQQQDAATLAQKGESVALNPYYYRLMMPGTLYAGSINHSMGIRWSSALTAYPAYAPTLGVNYFSDNSLAAYGAVDRSLAQMSVRHPELIQRTDQELRQEPRLREEAKKPIETEAKLVEKAAPVELGTDVTEPVIFQARRPKFWKVTGSGSLQFTQSYYSENWYQGGEKNYAALTSLTINANYDNKKKLQWDNKLEIQLGFQTSSDTCHKFKATSNLLRVTSKLGYQAAKSWYYTGQVQAYTQLAPNYNYNQRTIVSDFFSPLYLTISVGMDYKFNSKKSKFSGSLLLAPVAYNMRYVHNDSLALRRRYNIEDDKVAYHNFGPSMTLNYKWLVCKNVTWEARMYYFTNLSYVDFEWENTFTFTINKYLSAKFFVYPRFDDSSKSYKGKHSYFMMKEWLSLGLNYSF